MDGWLRSSEGKKLTIGGISELAREVQMTAITSRNIILGFSNKGIFPFNQNIFSDGDFAPSSMTDRLLESQDISFHSTSSTIDSEINSELGLHGTTVDENIDILTICQDNSLTAITTDYVSPAMLVSFSNATVSRSTKPLRQRHRSTKVLSDTL